MILFNIFDQQKFSLKNEPEYKNVTFNDREKNKRLQFFKELFHPLANTEKSEFKGDVSMLQS